MKSVEKLLVITFFTSFVMTFTACKKDAENPPIRTPVITTVAVSVITATSVETGGSNVTSPGGAEVTFRGVCWSTNPSPTVADSKTIEGTGLSDFTSTINGLTPNTTYYVRAYAVNSAGTSYGNEISFKTKDFPPAFTTMDIKNITIASAISGGEFLPNGGEDITERGVCWGTSSNPTTDSSKTTGVQQSDGTFISYITGLQPSTKYYVRAYTINAFNQTDYGNELSFTTSAITPIVFNPDLTYGSVSDIDGNAYKTIPIGTQIWMAENLKTTKYNDGTSISEVTDNTEWESLITPGYCWYNNDEASYKGTYGALYNWYAAKTDKLCPTGWHVPSNDEWKTLITYVGGGEIAPSIKMIETGNTHWLGILAGATNETGFTALPGGFRSVSNDFRGFGSLGTFGLWWSSTDFTPSPNALATQLPTYDDNGHWGLGAGLAVHTIGGLSVRCVKDN